MTRYRGARAPSRVVAGASAGHIFEFFTLLMECGDAIGEGADCDTRGRVCSPECLCLIIEMRREVTARFGGCLYSQPLAKL
jgi:hypothetical protein